MKRLVGAALLGSMMSLGLIAILGTAWVNPRTWLAHDAITASLLNTQLRDELLYLKENQASTAGFFRGLRLETDTDTTLANTQIHLNHADLVVMDDGAGVANWNTVLTADSTVSGAGGLDTGSIGLSVWYQIYAIRKSADDTRNLLLHQAPLFASDATNSTANATQNFRDTSNNQRIAQGFKPAISTDPVDDVKVRMNKVGAPTGTIYMQIETDSSGSPAGVALATSRTVDVSLLSTSAQDVIFVFPVRVLFTKATQYHMVLYSTVATSGTNYLQMSTSSTSTYPDGVLKTYNGSAWASTTTDLTFGEVIQELNRASDSSSTTEVPPTMPAGYDQKCLIGYAFRDGSGHWIPFEALDRLVTPRVQQTLVSPFSATVPTAFAMTGVMPPTGVKTQLFLYWSTTGGVQTNITIGPAATGYQSTYTIRGGGQVLASSPTVGVGFEAGPIINRSPWLFLKISTGDCGVYVGPWEWQ